jgi:uncharacterized repeat protein (TIGR02059 family)
MRTVFALIFLTISIVASATDYYVKQGGNDLDAGTSDGTAWASINKVNSSFASLKPGDRILFNRGDTFYGTIEITSSGVAGSPITLGAYGTGNKPVITGFTTITSWNNEGNGIYSSQVVAEDLTNMVVIDDRQYAMGRWPDTGYNIFESVSSNVSITDNELGADIDWTGAEVVIRKNDWSLDRCNISDHTGGSLTYISLGTTQDAIARHGYFIQNDLRTLTTFGEWYHNKATGKIYIYFGATDPATKKVEVATLNTLIDNTGRDYITVDNIHFRGSVSHLITCDVSANNNITIQNSQLSFAGLDGIHLWGENGTISNNLISECNQTGIKTVGNYHNILANVIEDVGVIPGQAFNGTVITGVLINDNNCVIKNNTITNIGYSGIKLSSIADIITIQNNFINNVLLTLNDGGGIYTAGEGVSRKIDGNIIMNVIGNTSGTPYPDRHIARGIYLDVNSTNVIITNNTVAYCSEGGYMIHRAHDNRLENNTAFNNGYGMFFQNSSGSNIRNNTLKNNIFFAKASTQLALKFYSVADDIPSFGTADNNVYARPADDVDVFHTYSPSTGSQYRTLTEWQSFTGKDLASKKSPVTLSDTSKIDFYYNPTTSNKAITLSQPMLDPRGAKYSGTITLLPYSSIILMPDPNPNQPSVPVYYGSVIENAAPSVLVMTFSLTLTSIVPSASAFTVKVNGTDRSVTSVSVSGSKVSLILTSPVVSGDVVTVAYTKPSSNPLRTAEGGEVASFTAQPVTNNCVTTNPPVNQPPVIIIASPVKGSSFVSPATVTIDVEAHDPDGSIQSVVLYNGNVKLGERSTAPYSFTLKELQEGSYELHAIATDNLSASATSASLQFHVTSSYDENREFFNLYPNPNDGRFYIDFTSLSEAERFTLTVYNIIGRAVYQTELLKDDGTRDFDLSHLNPGLYVVMISAGQILLTQKFIKN